MSCSIKKKPVFLKLGEIKLVSVANDTIKLKADAYFKNENNVEGKISTDEIQVSLQDKHIAQVSSEEFKVPANKEFSVPLKIAIPSKEVFKTGMLEGLLNTVLGSKSIKLHVKGNIKYKIMGFSKIYPIDKVEEITLNF